LSYYEVLLWLHASAAIVWLGSGFLVQLLIHRAEQTDDRVLTERLSANAGWLAKRMFIPVSLSVLVLGILLTIEGPWTFGQLWIVLGLAGYAASFLIGIGFIEPEGKRIHAAIAAHGPTSAEAGFHIRRINIVSRVELVILFLVVAVMSLKPTGEDTGTLAIGAAVVVATLAVGLRAIRAAAPAAAAASATAAG
jgi:uncharacterized membrane protein